jgi:Endonuclease/Exonuclease/phosphatase family
VAEVATGDRTLVVAGVHSSSPLPSEDSDSRNRELDHIVELTSDPGQPLIVAGDFNATPWSPHFRDLLAATGLRNAADGHGYVTNVRPPAATIRSRLRACCALFMSLGIDPACDGGGVVRVQSGVRNRERGRRPDHSGAAWRSVRIGAPAQQVKNIAVAVAIQAIKLDFAPRLVDHTGEVRIGIRRQLRHALLQRSI